MGKIQSTSLFIKSMIIVVKFREFIKQTHPCLKDKILHTYTATISRRTYSFSQLLIGHILYKDCLLNWSLR